MMAPFYQSERSTLYHGDALEVLRGLNGLRCVVVVDPVWPNGQRIFPGVDAWGLWSEACKAMVGNLVIDRLIVLLGSDSDPRFLGSVPESLPFIRWFKLRYPRTSYKGTKLLDGDIGYVFGEKAWLSGNGHRVLPSECRAYRPRWKSAHPCPRNPQHMLWVIENYTRPTDVVLDFFAGIGTTLWACSHLGRKSIGVEIERRWCSEAVQALDGFETGLRPIEARYGQGALFGGDR